MSAVVRSPYETILREADAIGQHARAAAEFARPVDRSAAYLFEMVVRRADEAVRQMKLRMREIDEAANGDGHGI